MNIRQDTTRIDLNDDGLFDETKTVVTEMTGARIDAVTTTKVNTLYPHSTIEKITYDYSISHWLSSEIHEFDSDGDGTFESVSTVYNTHDGDGRILQKIRASQDYDGDGNAGDYLATTDFTYNEVGSLTKNLTTYSAYGKTNAADYVLETWTYRQDGLQLVSYSIDDPMWFDCVITRTNTYNKAGQIANVKEQNEIRYGDERARIDESFTYDKTGTMKTKTDWADYSDKGWFQRVDTAFTWGDGYDSQKITYDKIGDWKSEAIKFVENWYNADNHLTHTLISHDDDGKGGPLAGGFDRRDLFVKTWVDDVMVAETRDFDIHDGVVEYSFSSELLVA